MTRPIDRNRLASVIGMLIPTTSDNEKLAALSRANAMLTAAGLTWSDLAAALPTSPNISRPSARPGRATTSRPDPREPTGFSDADADDPTPYRSAWDRRRMNRDDEPAQAMRFASRKIPGIISGVVVILDHDPVMVEIHAGNFIYGPLLVETALDWLTIQETEGFNVIGYVQHNPSGMPHLYDIDSA